MGRTHGVHAEPTTFGLVLANWYAELLRDQKRFDDAASDVEAGKISGAVGTFANTPPAVEAYVTDHLAFGRRTWRRRCCRGTCTHITYKPWG